MSTQYLTCLEEPLVPPYTAAEMAQGLYAALARFLAPSRLGGSLETPDKAEAFTKRLSQRLALCQMVRRTDPAVSRASGHAPVEGLERRRAGWPGHLG